MRAPILWVLLTLAAFSQTAPSGRAAPTQLPSRLSVPDPAPTPSADLPPISTSALRVDPGDHVGAVRAMAASEDGRFLATGSPDQTVRVWSAADLSPVRTWRPGMRVNALLVSNDGRSVAASSSAGGGFEMLLSAAGQAELPESLRSRVLWRLSADGTHALTLDHRCRVGRIPLAGGPEELLIDDSTKGDFDWLSAVTARGEGTLAVACDTAPPEDTHLLHVVSLGWERTVALDAPASGLALSPDGKVLAVGQWGRDAITLHDMAELRAGSDGGSVAFLGDGRVDALNRAADLAWSEDGSRLRGTYTTRGGDARLWELDLSTGAARTLATGPITAVAWLPGDRVAYGTSDGRMVLLNIRGEPERLSVRPSSALRADQPLRVSTDGARVQLRYESADQGQIERIFSMRDLLLDAAASTERLPEAAAASAQQQLVPGPDAPELLQSGASGDGAWVIGRHADGTLRWYRATDGALVVTLFPLADGRRWIAWTPHGYYATSIGGERLAGWEVSRESRDSADFFSLGRLSGSAYRPDIVAAAFQDQGEDRALTRLGEQPRELAGLLPPVVEPIERDEPLTRGPQTIDVKVRSELPVERWRVLVDGRPLAAGDVNVRAGTGSDADGLSRRLRLELPDGAERIEVFASSSAGTSEPATFRDLQRSSTVAPTRPAPAKAPDLNVLAVGVSDYQVAQLNLAYARKDALDLVDQLRRQARTGLYANIRVKSLTDGEATRANIEGGLRWLIDQTEADDVAMVFLSGHGETEDQRYYFVSHEVDPNDLAHTTLPGDTLRDALSEVPGRVILLLDTCKASGVVSLTPMVNSLLRPESGVVVMTSSRADQLSQESAAWKNGAFTRALVDGLNGEADVWHDGEITVLTLGSYVSRQVRKLTEGAQTPQLDTPGPIDDFVLARTRAAGDRACELPPADLDAALRATACAARNARLAVPDLGVQLSLLPRSQAQRRWCEDVSSLGCTLVEPTGVPPWAEGERVRVLHGALEHRGPLRVEGGTVQDPETLAEIARFLQSTPSVGLVIEARAPKPDDAAATARALWEGLLRAGVHPRRLSMRAVGDEAASILLHTVPRADDAALSAAIPLPWDGKPGPAPLAPVTAGGEEDCGEPPTDLAPIRLMDALYCAVDQLPTDQLTGRLRVPAYPPELARWCADTTDVRCEISAVGEASAASLRGDRIQIRQPIEFASGAAVLQPSASPILEQVVAILRDHPEIQHVVVEGHASQDGDFLTNDQLSTERARAIWSALVLQGVAPDRVSYRGLGEVLPLLRGDTAYARERNRRVEFYVIQEGR